VSAAQKAELSRKSSFAIDLREGAAGTSEPTVVLYGAAMNASAPAAKYVTRQRRTAPRVHKQNVQLRCAA
jgi:hypothetical protein